MCDEGAMCDEGTVYYEDHSGFNQVIVNALYSRYIGFLGIYMPLVCHVLSAFRVQRVICILNLWSRFGIPVHHN